MPFNSLLFLFLFLPLILLLYGLIDSKKRNGFLLIVSLGFYFTGAGDYLYLLLLAILGNYLFGISMAYLRRREHPTLFKLTFIAGLAFNIGFLLFFKYSAFLLENIWGILGKNPVWVDSLSSGLLPIGISFYSFLGISYLIDLYREQSEVSSNPVTLGLYISFFPKLMMGPITQYHRFKPQLTGVSVRVPDLYHGGRRLVIGLVKKVLIADSVAKVANAIFAVPVGELTAALSWTGAIAYTLQIYFDFSGYSDMAIGIGKMLGFTIPENFNYPYVAKSIKDFWKRWHITLAEWLQTYLFLPLAYWVLRRIKPDRKFGIRTDHIAYFFAAFWTMTLCGLWHGANWTFVVWGSYYGILLIIEHGLIGKFMKKRVPSAVRIGYTLFLVILGWVVFRSANLSDALTYLSAMFGLGGGDGSVHYLDLYLNRESLFFMLLGIVSTFPLWKRLDDRGRAWMKRQEGRWSARLYEYLDSTVFIALFLVTLIVLSASTQVPFIYAVF